jgi:hypothetical protein
MCYACFVTNFKNNEEEIMFIYDIIKNLYLHKNRELITYEKFVNLCDEMMQIKEINSLIGIESDYMEIKDGMDIIKRKKETQIIKLELKEKSNL